MDTKTNKAVAKEIHRQLGHKALCMLGANRFACSGNTLLFRIGRNCEGVNCIKITLNGLDLYDMQFTRIRGPKITVLAEHYNIYADMMHSIIETETGMRTSL